MWFSSIFEENDSILNKNIPYISTDNIIDIIKDQKFNSKKYKKNVKYTVEWKKAIPLINVSFHYHLLRDNNVPTLKEFIDDYERDNKSFLKLIPTEWYTGIKYRLIRSYPSLIRDIYFVSKTIEMGYKTLHTLQLDLNGIDAVIPFNHDKKIFFRLFFDSKKSRKYLNNKTKSHNLENYVNFGLNKKNRKIIGDIFLYSDESIEAIINKSIKGILTEKEESIINHGDGNKYE